MKESSNILLEQPRTLHGSGARNLWWDPPLPQNCSTKWNLSLTKPTSVQLPANGSRATGLITNRRGTGNQLWRRGGFWLGLCLFCDYTQRERRSCPSDVGHGDSLKSFPRGSVPVGKSLCTGQAVAPGREIQRPPGSFALRRQRERDSNAARGWGQQLCLSCSCPIYLVRS